MCKGLIVDVLLTDQNANDRELVRSGNTVISGHFECGEITERHDRNKHGKLIVGRKQKGYYAILTLAWPNSSFFFIPVTALSSLSLFYKCILLVCAQANHVLSSLQAVND